MAAARDLKAPTLDETRRNWSETEDAIAIRLVHRPSRRAQLRPKLFVGSACGRVWVPGTERRESLGYPSIPRIPFAYPNAADARCGGHKERAIAHGDVLEMGAVGTHDDAGGRGMLVATNGAASRRSAEL